MDVRPIPAKLSGIALIEALIAVVVLSIGLLGIAGMHAESMHTGMSALNRTRAIQLSQDFMERLLANRTAITNYNWGTIASGATRATLPSPKCTTATCAPADLASEDKTQWTSLLQHRDFGLPAGSASVTVDQRPGFTQLYDITLQISWKEHEETVNYTTNAIVNQAI